MATSRLDKTRAVPFLVRKSLLIILVFTFTCFGVHFRGKLKSEGRGASVLQDSSAVETADENRRIQQSEAQPAKPDRIKNYFEYNADTDRNGEESEMQDEAANSQGFDVDVLNEESNAALPDDSPDAGSYRLRRLQQAPPSPPIIQLHKFSKTTKNVTAKESDKNSKTKSPTKSPVIIPILNSVTNSCTSPAYKEFPSDIFGNRARARGAIIVHIAIVMYMFYCLAIVCENYFLPSLEECSQRMNLSQDVAGATFMAAGSSAPELFTAILGVFIAKGDVGTGTIVGSAVFNILFVIGLCSLYTVSTELNWWPVARDSAYYTFTVLVLIVCIYDGEVTTLESFILLVLYGVYVLIMINNIRLRDFVLYQWETHFKETFQPKPVDELNNLKTTGALQAVHYQSFQEGGNTDVEYGATADGQNSIRNPFIVRQPEITIFEAANQVIIMHKRLFRANTRFRAAAHLVIIRSKKAKQKKDTFYSELNRGLSMEEARKMSRLGPDESYWKTLPDPNVDGIGGCAKWIVQAPLHAALFYTIPDCKLKSNMFLLTFLASITWTAIFSYVMVWMVTLIGFTLGIPDSIMGITFLAAGTSVPDAYASIHVAKLGQADMAVSNSIGSNVFDILVGLALPWFVETAIVDPSAVSSINSKGLVYAVMLLFLSLLITIYLFHRHRWTLNPRLGYSLLITYGCFVVFSSALEFNLLGYVNPPMCGE